MSAVEKINRQIIEDRGWTAGSSLENKVARFLSSVFTADSITQQFRCGAYRIDFTAPDVQVAIEADGWHHRSPEGAAKDAERDSWLRHMGWVVLRVDDRNGEESLREQVARAAQIINALREAMP